jgi:hypothetical protein
VSCRHAGLGWLSLVVWVALAAGLASCVSENSGEEPKAHALNFPVGLAVHPAGCALVVNSNFDLTFNTGTLRVIDLNQLEERVVGALPQPDYNRDLILDEASVGLPNYGAFVKLVPTATGGLAVLPVRGGNQLVLVDLKLDTSGARPTLTLDCWSGQPRPGQPAFPACEGTHNVLKLDEDDPYDLVLIPDPAAAGGPGQTAHIASLRSGRITAVQIPARESESIPAVLHTLATDSEGNGELAFSPALDLIFVTARYFATRYNPIFYFNPTWGSDSTVRAIDLFSKVLGSETRSVDFSADGLRAAMVVRDPDTLLVLDERLGADGLPQNRLLGAVVLGNNPSRVRYFGNLLLVTSAQDDTVFVVDATTYRLLGVREDICKGPFDLAFHENGTVRWGLVSCFEDDQVVVLDLDPASDHYLEVVARVGKPANAN